MNRKTKKGQVPAGTASEGTQGRLILQDGSSIVYLVTYVNPITSDREVSPEIFETADLAIAECIEILNEGLTHGEDPQPSMIQVVIDPMAFLASLKP